jgi:hypothetical protein
MQKFRLLLARTADTTLWWFRTVWRGTDARIVKNALDWQLRERFERAVTLSRLTFMTLSVCFQPCDFFVCLSTSVVRPAAVQTQPRPETDRAVTNARRAQRMAECEIYAWQTRLVGGMLGS